MGDGICYPCEGKTVYDLKNLYPYICECSPWAHSPWSYVGQWGRCDQNSGYGRYGIGMELNCPLKFKLNDHLTAISDLLSEIVKSPIDTEKMIMNKKQIIRYLSSMKKRELTKQKRYEIQMNRQSVEFPNKKILNRKSIHNIPNKHILNKCHNFRKSHR
jgi:hypothetical protein